MRRGDRIGKRRRQIVLSIQVVAVYIAGLVVLVGNEMVTFPLAFPLVLALVIVAVLLVRLIWRW